MLASRGKLFRAGAGALDTGCDQDVVGTAVVALVDAIDGAIDGAGWKAVFHGPLRDGFTLALEPGFELGDSHDGSPERMDDEAGYGLNPAHAPGRPEQ